MNEDVQIPANRRPAPVQLTPSSNSYGPSQVTVTGVKIPFVDLVLLFLKIWAAWLIATLFIAAILTVPVIALIILGNHVQNVFVTPAPH